ncbi:MAG: response regulator [Alphaproteobacteria bacterium]
MPKLDKILMVEDDLDIQTVAEMALAAVGGHTVHLCSSGQQALDDAPGFAPDLILLDVMMPGMDGPTTYHALRERPDTVATPVIFMTAKVQPAELASYKALGAIGVIQKPFDPMTLADEVAALWTAHHG